MVHVGTATCPTSNNILHFSHPFFTFITLFSLKITHLCSFLHYYLFSLFFFLSSQTHTSRISQKISKFPFSLFIIILLLFSIFHLQFHPSFIQIQISFDFLDPKIQQDPKTLLQLYSFETN